MIVVRQKDIRDIAAMVRGSRRVLLAGCSGCVSVCLAGGEKEAGIMASSLRILRKREGNPVETMVIVPTRQCYPEFLEPMDNLVKEADSVISLACGVGVQYLAERYPDKLVVPAQDTCFAGGSPALGVWEERCGLCGECVLHRTGGICPVTRCAKSMLNGPCGGSRNGKCELDSGIDCAWVLIYEKMKAMGRSGELKVLEPPKDWSVSRDGGPRKTIREDVMKG